MEWNKKLEIAYDAFDKGLGIRPIARKYGVCNACRWINARGYATGE